MTHHDVIVLGVGSVGSAAAYHLARRGQRVLALEQFNVPHALGSHHGAHRIYRFAYAEGPWYVPLMVDALDRWRALEALWGEPLHRRTGGLDIGRPDGSWVCGSLAACRTHDLAHEVLGAVELAARFPAWRLPADLVAVHQPDAGMLFPERCVAAHVSAAVRAGAEVRGATPVRGWETSGDGVIVRTDVGDHHADRLVIAGGGWLPRLVPALAAALTPTRQVQCWFAPRRAASFDPERFPVWVAQVDEGHFYGFPEAVAPGTKIGWHDPGPPIDPADPDRSTSAVDELEHRRFVARFLPDADGPTLARAACLYTMSPDEHFVLGRLPEAPQVLVFGGDSGHAFKFASVLGAILAELVVDGTSHHDLSPFALARLVAPPPVSR